MSTMLKRAMPQSPPSISSFREKVPSSGREANEKGKGNFFFVYIRNNELGKGIPKTKKNNA